MNFRVTVNGNVYDVMVEEITGNTPAAVTTQPLPAAPLKAPSPSVQQPAGGTKLNSPLPGVVVDIKVSVGQTVKLHQVVAVIESMKMENEVFAPVAGKVTSILVEKGGTVEAGHVLLTIE